jgi:hypothetical protein
MTFGSFTLPVPPLRPFSNSDVSFEGAWAGRQPLERRGAGGSAMVPAHWRLAAVRAEPERATGACRVASRTSRIFHRRCRPCLTTTEKE